MAMLISCNNSGCGDNDDHRLNEETNEVICNKCGRPISVSEYAKNTLRSMKQVVKTVKSEFEVRCENCNAIGAPLLKRYGKTNTKVVCKQCGTISQHLSRYFVEALKMRSDVETVDATPEEMAEAGMKVTSKFNPAKTPQLESLPNAVVVTPPEDTEPVEPVKVEYYPWTEDQEGNPPEQVGPTTKVVQEDGAVVVRPLTDEPINVDKKAEVNRIQTPKPKPSKVVPGEDKIRQRLEKMEANVTMHQGPPPPSDMNVNDLVVSGVTDYAGDVED